ncbi:MAG TPA: efflux RND transporter periplasmic adaptor subunit [Chitinophagaceae bacterium]|nr:efflux RND transporter periplasmic adaptor subunit [Chitinophagaceae bacterium]
MTRKLIQKLFIGMSILVVAANLFACNHQQRQKPITIADPYMCPMHHQVVSNHPGTCPICGMTLERKSVLDRMKPYDSSLAWLALPPNRVVTGNYAVVHPSRDTGEQHIQVFGYIGWDDLDLNTVSARVTGRVEKLYVNYDDQRVVKGQPLMDIYSPELLDGERGLLQAMDAGDSLLIRAEHLNLFNLGMTETEIRKLMITKHLQQKMTIYSPFSGVSRSLDSKDHSGSVEAGIIREGMYIERGQTIFRISPSGRVWAILQVYQQDIGLVRPNDPVRILIASDPGDTLSGRVDFVEPVYHPGSRTARVRVYLPDTGRTLQIGSLIRATIYRPLPAGALYLPRSAVYDLGDRSVVWVEDTLHQVFYARNVVTGTRSGNLIQVSGVGPADLVVLHAGYMVDSDSFILN